MNSNVMHAKDAISAKLAKCFITINENRYEFIQIIDFKANISLKVASVAILGKIMEGHKVVGASGDWSGKMHFNQSVFREAMVNYTKTGVMPYFDIQVTNEDPTSAIGRQSVILKDCLLDGGILAKFEAGGDTLEEDISGTFDDCEMPEKFKTLEGMI